MARYRSWPASYTNAHTHTHRYDGNILICERIDLQHAHRHTHGKERIRDDGERRKKQRENKNNNNQSKNLVTMKLIIIAKQFPCYHVWFMTHNEQLILTKYSPVSQIWAFIVLPSTSMLRVANSTPIVDFDSKLNSFRVNRDSKLLLPTPESPINTTLNK